MTDPANIMLNIIVMLINTIVLLAIRKARTLLDPYSLSYAERGVHGHPVKPAQGGHRGFVH